MVPHYYRNVHAVVFVYDVTKLSSFEGLPQWIEECDLHQLTKQVPRSLVGNKCDRPDLVPVRTNVAQRSADQHGMPLFETSAKDDAKSDHVEAIFMTLAHKLKNSKPMMPPAVSELGHENGPRYRHVISVGRSQDDQYSQSHGSSGSGCAC